MNVLALILGFFLMGCSATRVLGKAEREKLGLTGVIYDARLCPTARDLNTGKLRESGECELVTCEPEQGELECRARPEPARPGQR